jgi:hypothetical protein
MDSKGSRLGAFFIALRVLGGAPQPALSEVAAATESNGFAQLLG